MSLTILAKHQPKLMQQIYEDIGGTTYTLMGERGDLDALVSLRATSRSFCRIITPFLQNLVRDYWRPAADGSSFPNPLYNPIARLNAPARIEKITKFISDNPHVFNLDAAKYLTEMQPKKDWNAHADLRSLLWGNFRAVTTVAQSLPQSTTP